MVWIIPIFRIFRARQCRATPLRLMTKYPVGDLGKLKINGLNAGNAAWNLLLAELAGVYADNFGRRPMFLTSTALMIVCLSFVMGVSAAFAKTKKEALGAAAVRNRFSRVVRRMVGGGSWYNIATIVSTCSV